jgi:ATP-dependent RNA helicase DDX24/MAK5
LIEEETDNSEEEEDMSDSEATSGCVKVINDVQFDFDVDIEVVQHMDLGDAAVGGPEKRKITKGPLRALILTPTRELAIQVRNHIQAVAKYADVNVIAIVGGMAPQKQIRQLDQAPDIVVATPGRLWDLVQEGHPHLAGIAKIRYLAIDETDRMVEKGHFEELTNLLEMINEVKKKDIWNPRLFYNSPNATLRSAFSWKFFVKHIAKNFTQKNFRKFSVKFFGYQRSTFN